MVFQHFSVQNHVKKADPFCIASQDFRAALGVCDSQASARHATLSIFFIHEDADIDNLMAMP